VCEPCGQFTFCLSISPSFFPPQTYLSRMLFDASHNHFQHSTRAADGSGHRSCFLFFSPVHLPAAAACSYHRFILSFSLFYSVWLSRTGRALSPPEFFSISDLSIPLFVCSCLSVGTDHLFRVRCWLADVRPLLLTTALTRCLNPEIYGGPFRPVSVDLLVASSRDQSVNLSRLFFQVPSPMRFCSLLQ